jgi:hypothetical protein
MKSNNPERIADNTALGRPSVPVDLGPVIASLLSGESRRVSAQRIEDSGGAAI